MAISIGSDQVVSLSSLTDNLTDTVQDSATVSGELFTSDGTSVTTFTLTSTGTDGNYRGTLTAATTALLTNGTLYQVKVTAAVGGNTLILWLETTAEKTLS